MKRKPLKTQRLGPEKGNFLSTSEQVLFWLLFALVLSSPYYRGLYFRFERFHFFLFICGIGVILAVLRARSRVPFPLPQDLALPFALFVLLYGVNMFFAADRGLAHQEFVSWGVYCLFFLLVASLKVPNLRLVLLLFGANGALLTLLGLFQAFQWISDTYILGMSLRAMFVGGRLYSTFQYPNTASAYIGMGYLALLGTILWYEEKEWYRFFASCLAFLTLAGVFFTYSRGGILILGVSVFLLFLILPHRMRVGLFLGLLTTAFPFLLLLPFLERFLHAPAPLSFFGILFAGAVISSSFRGLLKPLEERMKGWREGVFLLSVAALFVATGCCFVLAVSSGLIGGGGATRLLDVSLRTHNAWSRLIFYRDGFRIFLRRPVTGWGGGGWEALHFAFRSFPYATKTIHSLYIQVLVEGGLVGVVLLSLVLLALFRRGKAGLLQDPTPGVATLSGVLLLGFLHGLIDFDFSLGAYQLAVWFFAGCLAGISESPKAQNARARTFAFSPVLGGICLLAFAFISLSVAAEWRRITEYHLASEGKWDELLSHLEGTARLEPWNAEIRLALSQALRGRFSEEQSEALHRKARKAAEEALRLSPWNASIIGHLGVLYAEEQDFGRALPLLERAVVADPFEKHNYLNLARVCRYAARVLLGRGEKERALFFLEKGIAVKTLLEDAERRSLTPLDWNTEDVLAIVEDMRKLREKLAKGEE